MKNLYESILSGAQLNESILSGAQLTESIFTVGDNGAVKQTVNASRIEDIRNNARTIFDSNIIVNTLRMFRTSDKNIYISDDNILYFTGLKLTALSTMYMYLNKKVKDIFNRNTIRGISFSVAENATIGSWDCTITEDIDMKTSEGRFEFVNSQTGFREMAIGNHIIDIFPTVKNVDMIGEPIERLFIKQTRLEDCDLTCKKVDILDWNAQYPLFNNCQLRSTTDLTIRISYNTSKDVNDCMNNLLDQKYRPRKDMLKYLGMISDKNITNFQLKILNSMNLVLWITTAPKNSNMDITGNMGYAGEFHINGVSRKVLVWYSHA